PPSVVMAPAALRFTFLYVLLFWLPFPLGTDPFTEAIVEAWSPWNHIVPWVGEHLLGLGDEMIAVPTGSGDRTFDWVAMLCKLVLALVGAGVWTALDRRRRHDAQLSAALRLYARYVLAYTMLAYGFHKVFVLQMQFPSPGKLLTPLGEMSPMGLLWAFMGYSPAYTMFTGFAEVLGGALLLFRRTTTIGSLVSIAALGNVVMLDLCYDVPLKIVSIHLLLLAVVLLLPDLRRVVRALLNDREPAGQRPRWRSPLAKAVVLFAMACVTFGVNLWMWLGDETCTDPLCGAYDVATFVQDGAAHPALLDDSVRWRRVVVSGDDRLTVVLMDGTTVRHRMHREDDTLVLARRSGETGTLLEQRGDDGRVWLTGTVGDVRLELELRPVETSALPLASRGFHWVNEFPYHL
ncbi:MAG TPA: hypothetical protein VFG69_05315, partial [Nannocystaceae bacterium]|nr:hypothetical protein [Nannocystaceae bacterium]